MEIISRQQQQHDHPSPANSPSSNGSTTTQTPPLTPRPISRSEPNPYPTTFVQADTNSFKQVVQMLTGSSKPVQENPSPVAKISSIRPVKTGQLKKSKLYERRNSLSLKNGLMINNINNPSATNGFGSTRVHELLSPSILDFPALALSPVTPLTDDMFNKASPLTVGNSSSEEEQRVIAEKGFYLHPSPRGTTAPEPQLLPLFPVTSPRVIN